MSLHMSSVNFFAATSTSQNTSSHELQSTVASYSSLKCLEELSASGHGHLVQFSRSRVVFKVMLPRMYGGTRMEIRSEIRPRLLADKNCSSASNSQCRDVHNWISLCEELYSGPRCSNEGAMMMRCVSICKCFPRETQETVDKEDSMKDADETAASPGVAIAVKVLQFYKREISPLLPGSCRFVPTCSEYGMQAFKKYGVVKGAILTAWRLSRCNPLGGSGFDPPRWFDEPRPPPY